MVAGGNHGVEVLHHQAAQRLQIPEQTARVALKEGLDAGVVVFLELVLHDLPEAFFLQFFHEVRYQRLGFAGGAGVDEEHRALAQGVFFGECHRAQIVGRSDQKRQLQVANGGVNSGAAAVEEAFHLGQFGFEGHQSVFVEGVVYRGGVDRIPGIQGRHQGTGRSHSKALRNGGVKIQAELQVGIQSVQVQGSQCFAAFGQLPQVGRKRLQGILRIHGLGFRGGSALRNEAKRTPVFLEGNGQGHGIANDTVFSKEENFRKKGGVYFVHRGVGSVIKVGPAPTRSWMKAPSLQCTDNESLTNA